jgi:protein phosphatase 1G
MKRIKKAGGFVSGGRVNESLNLSRSIGDIEFKNNRQLNAA